MKTSLSVALCLSFSWLHLGMMGQVLQMNFEVDSITTVVGPSPYSFSSSIGTMTGGASGKGLAARRSPSVPKVDINMNFANTGNIWDLDGMTVSLDFNREESDGWFFTRMGNDFRFGMTGGSLQVRYEVSDSLGGSTTVNSGNIMNIPNDDTFRNFAFTYDPASGTGTVYLNGSSIWSNDGPDNRALFWDGAGDMRIGDMMDATGEVEPIIDNILIYSTGVLPINLVKFTAYRTERSVALEWQTNGEVNNDYFVIERSLDAKNWSAINRVPGNGSTSRYLQYIEHDFGALDSAMYYRLKQVDTDGSHSYSQTVFIPEKEVFTEGYEVVIQTIPNPVEQGGNLKLKIENLGGHDLLLVMRDVAGNEIFVKTIYVPAEEHYEVMEFSQKISAGQYIITATSQGKYHNCRVIFK